MFGVLLTNTESFVCVYNQCHNCEHKCLRKVMFYLRKLRIEPVSTDKSHSTVLRYTTPQQAMQALQAIETVVGMQAKLIYPI